MLSAIKKNVIRPLREAAQRWSTDGGALLSAAVAYYVAVSLFPLLMVLLSGLGWFFNSTKLGKDAEAQLLAAVATQLSPELRQPVGVMLDQVRGQAAVGGPVGLVMLLAAAIAVFVQFDAAFDRIWKASGEHRPRGVWGSVKHVLLHRLKAFLLLMALGGMLLAVFVSGLALSRVRQFTGDLVPWADQMNWAVGLAASFALNALALTLLYRWLPLVHVPIKAALGGGLLAAAVWEIGRQVLAAVVVGPKYGSAYGVVGALLAIMLWAYYAVSVLLFGAEFAQVLRLKSQGPAGER